MPLEEWATLKERSVGKLPLKGLSKIVLAGSGGVGKTCIVTRLITGKYFDSTMTVGLDIESWSIVDNKSGESFRVVSYDLGGQHHFRFFQESMILGAQIGIVVFDVTRYDSFFELEEWIEMLGSIPMIVVGNKADLEFVVQEEEIIKIAERYNTSVIMVSAMTGKNMETLEKTIMRMLSETSINPCSTV